MELDALKTAWRELDARLQRIEAGQLERARSERLATVRRPLRGAMACQAVELAVWTVFVVVAAQFWFAHRQVPHLLAAGLVLHVYGVVAIVSAVLQLLMLAGVHAEAPVLVVQRRMAHFMRVRTLSRLALGLPWWCLWLVCTLVGAQALYGVDLYAAAPGWIVCSLGVGVLGMAGSVLLARRWTRRPPSSPLLRQMIDDMSGRGLQRARRELDALARFGEAG